MRLHWGGTGPWRPWLAMQNYRLFLVLRWGKDKSADSLLGSWRDFIYCKYVCFYLFGTYNIVHLSRPSCWKNDVFSEKFLGLSQVSSRVLPSSETWLPCLQNQILSIFRSTGALSGSFTVSWIRTVMVGANWPHNDFYLTKATTKCKVKISNSLLWLFHPVNRFLWFDQAILFFGRIDHSERGGSKRNSFSEGEEVTGSRMYLLESHKFLLVRSMFNFGGSFVLLGLKVCIYLWCFGWCLAFNKKRIGKCLRIV